MTRFITLTAVLLPFLEIPGFILVSHWIGVIPMLGLVLAGVLAGIMVLQRVGINAVVSLRLALAKGEEPGHTLIDAACFALAGFLLTIPGFISDLIALALFLPWTRNYLLRRAAGYFDTRFQGARAFRAGIYPGPTPSGQPPASGPSPGRARGTILEGEYSVVEEPEEGDWEKLPDRDDADDDGGDDSGDDSGRADRRSGS